MFTTISVLVPTRKRVQRLDKMLKSLWNTCQCPDSVEVVCRCDHDDIATQDFIRKRSITAIVGPRRNGYASLPIFMNECARLSRGDLLFMCNDDCIFKTNGWDTKIFECANRFSDGIFNIGVNTSLNANLFPFSIVSRRLLNALGFINDERLLFSDIFLLDLMKEFGRAIPLPSVSIYHDWANSDDDLVRLEASVIEKTTVFDGSPGDPSDPKRNWRPDYRDLHMRAVTEAVKKILQSGYISSQKVERIKEVNNSFHLGYSLTHPKRDEEISIEFPVDVDVLYDRDQLTHVFNMLVYKYDLCQTALISSFINWDQLKLWGSFIDNVLSIRENSQSFCIEENVSNCTLVTLPVMDLISLNRFKDFYVGNQHKPFSSIDTLILEDGPYPKVLVSYFIFKRILTRRKAAIVFVHAENDSGQSGIYRLLNGLQKGEIDNQNHSIQRYINPATKRGFSIEVFCEVH